MRVIKQNGKPEIAILLAVFLSISNLYSQNCPISEAAFLNGTGGPFVGDCALDVGGELSINGVAITWTTGSLSLYNSGGGNANLRIINGGSFVIQGGSVTVTNGRLLIGIASDNTTVSSALLQVDAGAALTTTGGGDNVIRSNSGTPTFVSNGNVLLGGDLVVNGGHVVVSGGTLEIDRAGNDGDLEVFGGGSITVGTGATVIVEDGISNTCSDPPCTGTSSQGTFIIEGSISAGTSIDIVNTTPDSRFSGSGTGQVSVITGFSDGECEYPSGVLAFCNCTPVASPCSAAMPIELLTFSAFQDGNMVRLEWSTASEINNDFFEVERLILDGEFQSIATVPGSGTTQALVHYATVDTNPNHHKNYYRLKQTDYDGQSTTSHVIVVAFEKNASELKIFPNPTQANRCMLSVSGLTPERTYHVRLKTALGYPVFTKRVETNYAGEINYELIFDKLPSGCYLVEVAGKSAKIFAKE